LCADDYAKVMPLQVKEKKSLQFQMFTANKAGNKRKMGDVVLLQLCNNSWKLFL
jgi:hypothetical protein